MLRLAHKYLIDGLRAKALEHLHFAWPTTLQGWDVREDLLRGWNGPTGGGGGGGGGNAGASSSKRGLEREWNQERRFPHPIVRWFMAFEY